MIAMLEKIGDKLIGKIVPAVPVKAAVEWREQCACDNFTSRTWYRWCYIVGGTHGCGPCNIVEYHGC